MSKSLLLESLQNKNHKKFINLTYNRGCPFNKKQVSYTRVQ